MCCVHSNKYLCYSVGGCSNANGGRHHPSIHTPDAWRWLIPAIERARCSYFPKILKNYIFQLQQRQRRVPPVRLSNSHSKKQPNGWCYFSLTERICRFLSLYRMPSRMAWAMRQNVRQSTSYWSWCFHHNDIFGGVGERWGGVWGGRNAVHVDFLHCIGVLKYKCCRDTFGFFDNRTSFLFPHEDTKHFHSVADGLSYERFFFVCYMLLSFCCFSW